MNKNLLTKVALTMVSPLCICHKCPSYPGGGDPKVYCERDKSSKEITKNGCVCSNCPVWKINHFTEHYYCIVGKDEKSKL